MIKGEIIKKHDDINLMSLIIWHHSLGVTQSQMEKAANEIYDKFLAPLQWQPIEIAPKDDRIVLLYNPIWKGAFTGMYREDIGEFVTDLNVLINQRPTHWMPIPQLPTEP